MALVTTANPDDLATLITQLGTTAEDIKKAGAQVQQAVDSISSWQGTAANTFRAAITEWMNQEIKAYNAVVALEQSMGVSKANFQKNEDESSQLAQSVLTILNH
ncbi:MAG TPA: WXG100 family type VII secretion target [Streptosporangiaceae bacterium]|jgi:uncharacterized protein YukE|nr:WXG100 family type VII secretion target [Streptosporangiaceae bacterium]